MAGKSVKYVVTRGKAPSFEGFGTSDRKAGHEWLEMMKRYFAEEGRKGGQVGGKSTSKAKATAARQNGKLGGRPKGSRNKNERMNDD